MANKTQLVTTYGPWAVVTGASSGIGKAFAEQLADAGTNLVLVARRKNILEKMAADFEQKGVDVRIIQADLANGDEAGSIAAKTADLDVGLLVASAGFGTSGEFASSSLEAELKMLDVNCRALLMMSHQFGQRFKAQGRGGMILLSSILAFQGAANSAHYSATKGYVHQLAEGLAQELEPHGVDVLALAPGPTMTGFATAAGMQMGSGLTPDTVAKEALQKLGRRRTVLPGGLSKILRFSSGTLPRPLRVRLFSRIMGGMVDQEVQLGQTSLVS